MKIVNIKIYDGAEWVSYELGAASNSVITNNYVAIDGTGINQPFFSTDVGIIATDESSAEEKIKPNTYYFDETSAKAFCESFGEWPSTKTINLIFENPQFGQHTGIEYYFAAPSTYALVFLPNRDVVGTYNTDTGMFTMDGGFISPYIMINEAQLPVGEVGLSDEEALTVLKILFPALEMEKIEYGYALPAFVGDDINSKKLKFGKGKITKNADGSIENFEFLNSEAKIIAVIDDNIGNGLVAWDNTNGKLVAAELDLNLANGEAIDSLTMPFSGTVDENNYANINKGTSSLVIGTANKNNPENINGGHRSIVYGRKNTNTGSNNIVGGLENTNSGNSCNIGGGYNTNSGAYVTMGGLENDNSGNVVIMGGERNTNTADWVIMNGLQNTNHGKYALINGWNNINEEDTDSSFITGRGNHNKGYQSQLIGVGLINEKSNPNAVLVGQYNDNTITGTVFVVGNGTSDTDRKNALTIYKEGRVTLDYEPKNDNDVVRLKDIKNRLTKDITGDISVSGTTTTQWLAVNGTASFAGNIYAQGNPTQSQHVVNKGYVDAKFTELNKLIDGLTDAQISALNKFAKSLTVEE